MNSLLASITLVASLAVAPPPPPIAGHNGVHPGVGPGIHRPSNVPRPLEPGINGVRPGVGPEAHRPHGPEVRPLPPPRHHGGAPRPPRPPKPCPPLHR